MTGKTHIAGGIAAGAAVGLALNLTMEHFIIATFAGGVGGLIPDIDSATSTITSKTGPAGFIISRIFRHRGVLHTPVAYIVLNCVLWIIAGNIGYTNIALPLLMGMFAGEISHLLLDSLNRVGIMWLWPYPRRFSVLHVPSNGRFNTLCRYVLWGMAGYLIAYKIMRGC